MSEIGRSVPSLYNDEELLERMDWQPTGKDHFFVRYFYQNAPYLNAGGSVVRATGITFPISHTRSAATGATLSPLRS